MVSDHLRPNQLMLAFTPLFTILPSGQNSKCIGRMSTMETLAPTCSSTPGIVRVFPYVFQWLSYCFPMVFLLFTCCFRIVFRLFSYCFLVVFIMFSYCIPVAFVWFSYCFPKVFLLFSDGFPIVCLLSSYRFLVVLLYILRFSYGFLVFRIVF